MNNQNKPWSVLDICKLKYLINENTSTERISNLLGRTEEAIYQKASELNWSLKPKDK